MNQKIKSVVFTSILVTSNTIVFAQVNLNELYTNHIKNKLMFQAGFYGAHQGQLQQVMINNLIGDQFTVTDNSDINALIGLGYYKDFRDFSKFKLQYGLDVLYLMQTSVNGQVIQENLFNNLSYSYKVSHIPFYAALKAITETPKKGYELYFDGGIGPNIMVTSGFNEQPLNSYTLGEQLFKGATTTRFSAMAGIGIRATEIFSHPLECGYRFMYLGEGRLNINNTEVTNQLSTGENYAHSLVCGILL